MPSRLSDHASIVPATTGEALIDSLDLELDALGVPNNRNAIPYGTFSNAKPPIPLTQINNPAIQTRTNNGTR